jgi:hypothetical protein
MINIVLWSLGLCALAAISATNARLMNGLQVWYPFTEGNQFPNSNPTALALDHSPNNYFGGIRLSSPLTQWDRDHVGVTFNYDNTSSAISQSTSALLNSHLTSALTLELWVLTDLYQEGVIWGIGNWSSINNGEQVGCED